MFGIFESFPDVPQASTAAFPNMSRTVTSQGNIISRFCKHCLTGRR